MIDSTLQNIEMKAFKVILVGPQGVGKSSILNRLTSSVFNTNYNTTIGIDFKVYEIQIQNIKYSLKIWDTAGQQKFRSLTDSYYKGSNACVCVFDLSQLQTLNKCQYYIQKALSEDIPQQCIYLLGNKSDLGNENQKQGQNFAKKYSISYNSVSAKEGTCLNMVFDRMAKILAQKRLISNQNIKLNKKVIIEQKGSTCKC